MGTGADIGTVCYAKQEHLYILKFIGEIRYTMSCSVDTFLDRLFANDDFDNILIDLTETTSIDSTNLGLLAKIANFVKKQFGHKATIISTNPDINGVLDSLGFDQVFMICDDRASCREAVQQLSVKDPSRAELAKTLFETHSRLSEMNEENRETFKNVLDVFKDGLLTE